MSSRILDKHKGTKPSVYNKQLGILFNGQDNYYPLVHENLIKASPTAKKCAGVYGRFLTGAGFEDERFEDINLTGQINNIITPNDFLDEFVMENVSIQGGCFVHIKYNALLQKVGYKILPYNLCRIGKKDSDNYSGKVVLNPDGWGWNYGRSANKKNLMVFDSYNPNEKVIRKQIEAVGGIEKWGGQVAFFRLDSKYDYPLSPIDSVVDYCHTESQLAKYYSGTVERGFSDVQVIHYDKRVEDVDDVVDTFKSVSGVDSSGSMIFLESDSQSDEKGEGHFRIEPLKSEATPEKYEHFENVCKEKIRGAFDNIPSQLVQETAGGLINNGEDLVIAQSIYNITTAPKRKKIERFFKELFRNYKEPIESEFKIKQYKIIDNGTTQDGNNRQG